MIYISDMAILFITLLMSNYFIKKILFDSYSILHLHYCDTIFIIMWLSTELSEFISELCELWGAFLFCFFNHIWIDIHPSYTPHGRCLKIKLICFVCIFVIRIPFHSQPSPRSKNENLHQSIQVYQRYQRYSCE